MKRSLLSIFVGLISSVLAVACSSFGSDSSEEKKLSFKNSLNYDSSNGVFKNRRPKLISEMEKEAMDFKTMWDFFFGSQADRVPVAQLPELKPDLGEFIKESEDLKSIWLGHSSFLLNMNGKIILVDPVFSGAASPIPFSVKRFQKPVLKLNELPEIDFILISHDHYDHLDMESIKFFKEKNTQFIAPLGVGSHMQSWGIEEERIFEKDWWQSHKIEGLEFIATPAQHFSGRSLFDRNHSLWASWVIRSDKHSVYFSGDSGYDVHFKEIGDKYGPFDLAFVENGQYNKKWRAVHLLPEETIQATKDLKAKRMIPVHWGMFELSMHAWYEPIEESFLRTQAENFQLIAPKIGQMIYLNDSNEIEKWWESVPREAKATESEEKKLLVGHIKKSS